MIVKLVSEGFGEIQTIIIPAPETKSAALFLWHYYQWEQLYLGRNVGSGSWFIQMRGYDRLRLRNYTRGITAILHDN